MGVLENIFSPKKPINLTVHLDDGSQEILYLQPYVTAENIINHVLRRLGIHDAELFGLSYVDPKGDVVFMKALHKLDSKNIPKIDANFQIFLGIKYFPSSVDEILEEKTREYFYSVCKKKFLAGIFHASWEAIVQLTCYSLQIDCGDISETLTPSNFHSLQFLPAKFLKSQNFDLVEFLDSLNQFYREQVGKPKAEAIEDYITICTSLPNYGVHYFPIQNKNQTRLLLGVNGSGFHIFTPSDKGIPKASFSWDELDTISYSGKKFTIRFSETGANTFNAYCTSMIDCKQLFQICVGYHSFFKRLVDSTPEGIAKRAQIQERRDSRLRRWKIENQADSIAKTSSVEELPVVVSFDQTSFDEELSNSAAAPAPLPSLVPPILTDENLDLNDHNHSHDHSELSSAASPLQVSSPCPDSKTCETPQKEDSSFHELENISFDKNAFISPLKTVDAQTSPECTMTTPHLMENVFTPSENTLHLTDSLDSAKARIKWRRNKSLFGMVVNKRIEFFESM